MELEGKKKCGLWKGPEAAGLRDVAGKQVMEIGPAGEPDRRENVAPLILSALVLVTGIVVFRRLGWQFTVASPDACRPGAEAYYSICYSPFGWFLLGPAMVFSTAIAAGVEGVRGRRYRRWLLLATALVVVPIAAKFLEVWVAAGGG